KRPGPFVPRFAICKLQFAIALAICRVLIAIADLVIAAELSAPQRARPRQARDARDLRFAICNLRL
ncbi:MAG TPA: hypothetical protein VFV98_06445, partial [Vicinamibacterales bacterium]|nr:hypothetical protein [Vicinamibacterales bacterium]